MFVFASVRETVPVSRNLNFSSAALLVYYCPHTHAQSEVDGAEQEHVMFSYSMEMLLEGGGGLQSSLQRKQQTFTI